MNIVLILNILMAAFVVVGIVGWLAWSVASTHGITAESIRTRRRRRTPMVVARKALT